MQEECDFQSTFVEKKLSSETRLDGAASSALLSETEIKKSVRISSDDRSSVDVTLPSFSSCTRNDAFVS